MDYDELYREHLSVNGLLLQQVDEQSDYCDVTIKVGTWVKRFHWCVLVVSPFFEAIYRNQSFIEHSSDLIELHDTVSIREVESAILFLYGKTLYITEDNVAELLHWAEFLLMPRMTETCHRWMRTVKITENNCFRMLHLASMYKLHLHHLELFVKANMVSLLKNELSRTFEKETIEVLLKDSSLSYVGVKNWFPFLVKWTNSRSDRESQFSELFRMLDLSYVDPKIQQLLINEELIEQNNLRGYVLQKLNAMAETSKVLLFTKGRSNKIFCLNIGNGKWHTLRQEELSKFQTKSATSCETEIIEYKVATYCNKTMLECHNVSTNISRYMKFLYDDHTSVYVRPELVCIKSPFCYVLASKDSSIRDKGYGIENDIRRRKSYLFKTNIDNNTENAVLQKVTCFKSKYFRSIVVDAEHNIAMLALLQNSVLNLLVYNDVSRRLDNIDLDISVCHDKETQLTALSCGFVVVTSTNTVQIIKVVHRTSVKNEGFTVTSLINTDLEHYLKWIYGDFCYFWCDRSYTGSLTYVHIDKLSMALCGEAEWKQSNFPHCMRDQLASADKSAKIVNLPTKMLRCVVDCPHCELASLR